MQVIDTQYNYKDNTWPCHQGGTGEKAKSAILEKSDTVRSRHNSFEPTHPLAPEVVQLEQVQKLKEHVGSLVQAKVTSIVLPTWYLSILVHHDKYLGLWKYTNNFLNSQQNSSNWPK